MINIEHIKKIRVGERSRAILFYAGLLGVVGLLIGHGILQEIHDYHPRVAALPSASTPTPAVASQSATPSSTLKNPSTLGTSSARVRTVQATPTSEITQSMYHPTSVLVSPTNNTSPTSSPSHAVIQSAIEENPVAPLNVIINGLVNLGN